MIISDDDGGEDGKTLQIAVTGDSDCIRGKGFWSHQFSGTGGGRVDDYALQAYLDIVNYFSKVFSEEISLKNFEEASAIFRWNTKGGGGQKNKSMSMKDQALGHLLATWLNFSDGAITYEMLVDTDFDNIPETKFAEAIEWVESIFTDPDSNRSDFIEAKVICESISSMGACSPSLGIQPAHR